MPPARRSRAWSVLTAGHRRAHSLGMRDPGRTVMSLRAWLLTECLPLWLRHGLDHEGGGFHEFLEPGRYACDAPFRRLRVVARQIATFSWAHKAGVPGAAAAADFGLHYLRRHAALAEGGYAWRFNLRNEPVDTTRDLYDHAFVLLALSAACAVEGAASLRAEALALLGFLDTRMAHPAGGYAESIPPALPRRQNPHMHLLEALLAAHRAFGDPVFLQRAGAIVALFGRRLLDEATGALPEYFDDRLHPVREGGRFVVEPGHHCEWVWLLHAYARQAGAPRHLSAMAGRLMAFAQDHGRHPATGDLVDSVDDLGAPLQRSARLWPQCERLRAELVSAGRPASARDAAAAGLAAWLRPDGLWHERRDAAGAFLPGPCPASTLYHLTGAILSASGAD